MILTLTNNSNTIYLDTGLIAFVFADGGNTYITLNTEPIEAVRIDPALSGVLFDNSGLYGVQTIEVAETYSAIKTASTGYGFGEFTHAAYTNVWVNCVAVHRVLSVGGNAKLLFRRIADVQTTTSVSTALTTISTATTTGGGGGGITQLTGDVTAGPGSGSQAATIANSAVTNAKMANMAGLTLKGNNTSSPAAPADLTPTQVTALLTLGGLSITGGAITSSDTLIGALGKLQNQINLIMTVPTNSVAPVISGSTTIGATLTSTTGTWSAIGPITYTYQWRRGASDIVGATSSTYVTVLADNGQNITCRVTATTNAGSANADSNIIVPISVSYLLDSYATNTAYGWSVARQLKTTATAAIRIRRSNDNAETDIGFSGGGLDTAAITSFVGANSAFITKIYEQVGSTYHWQQTTASNQFRIVNAGTIQLLNTKPAALCNVSTSCKMTIPSSTGIFLFMRDGTNSSLFGVYKKGVTTSSARPMISTTNSGAGGSGTGWGVVNWTDGKTYIQAWNSGANYNYNGTPSTTPDAQILVSFYVDADNATAANRTTGYLNGGTAVNDNTLNYNIYTGNNSNDYFLGNGITATTPIDNFQELIILPSQPTLSTFRTNINGFYNIY